MQLYIGDSYNKSNEGADYLDQQRIHRYAMNIRQMAFKIKSCNAEQRSTGRLHCPSHGQEQCKPVLNRRIVTDEPKGRCGSAYHGYSTKVMYYLDKCINKILHVRNNYLTVAVTEPCTPVIAWLDVASFTTMVCLPGDSFGNSMLHGQWLTSRKTIGA